MKLTNKIIFLVGITVLIITAVLSSIFYSESKQATIKAGEEKALAVIEAFDLTLVGNETEESLQKYLLKLKDSDLEIVEFNIYQLGDIPTTIASLDEEMIGKEADPEDLAAAKNDETVVIIEGDLVDVTTPLHSNGEIKYVAGIMFSMTDEINNLNHLMWISLLIVLLILIVTITIVWLIVNRMITRALNALVLFSERIANGDLTLDTNEISNHRKDEIGVLTRSFYQMAVQLRRIVEHIAKTSTELEHNAKIFSQLSEQTRDTEREIAVSIEEIVVGAKTQLISISESSIAIDEMRTGIEQIANSTEEVANSSIVSIQKADNGNQVIKETVNAIENLVRQSKESASRMELLSEKTKEIDQIIIVIAQISSQTNLLALNASIEAARAGEQGRGFAVVANEVKKLAEQSKVASDHVSSIIQAVQYETMEVVKQINENSAQTEEGLKAVRLTGASFEQISNDVNSVSKQVINVSAIVEEMSASSEEISATIQSIVNTVEDSTEKSEHVAEATIKSMENLESLMDSSQNLTKLSKELSQIISVFKL
jgi:methyl-accepting chemotaxis protein